MRKRIDSKSWKGRKEGGRKGKKLTIIDQSRAGHSATYFKMHYLFLALTRGLAGLLSTFFEMAESKLGEVNLLMQHMESMRGLSSNCNIK